MSPHLLAGIFSTVHDRLRQGFSTVQSISHALNPFKPLVVLDRALTFFDCVDFDLFDGVIFRYGAQVQNRVFQGFQCARHPRTEG